MQTTAKYPAPLSTLNLKTIPTLIEHFKTKIGLSDHSRDPIIGPVTAVALGATIIEKHFTLDNKLPGPDHSFALLPDELKIMVKSIRDCEKSLGVGKKIVQPEEVELREVCCGWISSALQEQEPCSPIRQTSYRRQPFPLWDWFYARHEAFLEKVTGEAEHEAFRRYSVWVLRFTGVRLSPR